MANRRLSACIPITRGITLPLAQTHRRAERRLAPQNLASSMILDEKLEKFSDGSRMLQQLGAICYPAVRFRETAYFPLVGVQRGGPGESIMYPQSKNFVRRDASGVLAAAGERCQTLGLNRRKISRAPGPSGC